MELRQATTFRERISSIDVLRGFALLGILVLNINDFSGPEALHSIPFEAEFSGPHGSLNLVLFFLKWLVFEGKMRGIFSMLFGVGVILMTQRADKRGESAGVADVYLRRNLLLVAIGLVHSIFLWHGDILFDYGFWGLLLLYPARKLSARALIILGVVVALVLGTLAAMTATQMFQNVATSDQVTEIETRVAAGHPATEVEAKVVKDWQDKRAKVHGTAQGIKDSIAAHYHPYWQDVGSRASVFSTGPFARAHLLMSGDVVGAMLIGMGLMKLGFFSAELSYGVYGLVAWIGFAISLPLCLVGLIKFTQSGYELITADLWLFLPYGMVRVAGMLAIAAVIMIVVKRGVGRAAQNGLAAVGRTALSNYLLTTIVCQFVFAWGPWKLYGALAYYEVGYVVLGVWALNLVASVVWLRFFEFGPVEWLWRSLTYGKLQSSRGRRAIAASTDIAPAT